MNFEYDQEPPQSALKNFIIHSVMKTGQTLPADEIILIWSKAPEKVFSTFNPALKGKCSHAFILMLLMQFVYRDFTLTLRIWDLTRLKFNLT